MDRFLVMNSASVKNKKNQISGRERFFTDAPKISVIMSMYDTNPKFLRKAIESILSQTFQDFEFLILNDSPSNTALNDIVKSYKDKRICLIVPKNNLGLVKAHNKLLLKAKGKYVALMDHDDISLKTRLEKQFNYMEEHPETGLCGCAYKRFGRIEKRGIIRHSSCHKDICANFLFKCSVLHPSLFIRKSVLEKHKITYDRHFLFLNDRKFYWDISRYTKLHNLNDVLYKYRIHNTMASAKYRQIITKEQMLFREKFLKSYQVQLTPFEYRIMNEYLLKGRAKIKNEKILNDIVSLLQKLIFENKKNRFADEKAFQNVCEQYLIKRCKNACLYGFVSSYRILKKHHLTSKAPIWLRVFNFVKRKN